MKNVSVDSDVTRTGNINVRRRPAVIKSDVLLSRNPSAPIKGDRLQAGDEGDSILQRVGLRARCSVRSEIHRN